MGKKSKSKARKGKGKGDKKASAANSNSAAANHRRLASAAPPAGAHCYLCLDDGTPDAPLVRDCACRGASGWAHLGCLLECCRHGAGDLAKAGAGKNTPQAFMDVWQECRCCKQKHQNYLLLELSRSGRNLLYETYPGEEEVEIPGHIMVLDATTAMLEQHNEYSGDSSLIELANAAAERILAICGEIHPTSAAPHVHLGKVEQSKGTRQGLRQAIHHWERVKVCCAPDDFFTMATADLKINDMKAALGMEEGEKRTYGFGSSLDMVKKMYEEEVKTEGIDSAGAIHAARTLARSLYHAGRCIEAQRFLVETIQRGRRVFGASHFDTKESRRLLDVIQKCHVVVLPDIHNKFEAVGFDDATKQYMIRGPILKPRNEAKEAVRRVPMGKVLLTNPGTPVLCVGLKNASHLNGKLGDAASRAFSPLMDFNDLRYPVTFEDKGLGTKSVKFSNLRIAFDFMEECRAAADP